MTPFAATCVMEVGFRVQILSPLSPHWLIDLGNHTAHKVAEHPAECVDASNSLGPFLVPIDCLRGLLFHQ